MICELSHETSCHVPSWHEVLYWFTAQTLTATIWSFLPTFTQLFGTLAKLSCSHEFYKTFNRAQPSFPIPGQTLTAELSHQTSCHVPRWYKVSCPFTARFLTAVIWYLFPTLTQLFGTLFKLTFCYEFYKTFNGARLRSPLRLKLSWLCRPMRVSATSHAGINSYARLRHKLSRQLFGPFFYIAFPPYLTSFMRLSTVLNRAFPFPVKLSWLCRPMRLPATSHAGTKSYTRSRHKLS